MTMFVQLHLLTSYPPANLNRDDSGQPKTAMMGGALRARVSSQSLKRAWRTSDAFRTGLVGHIGTRTKRFAENVTNRLIAAGTKESEARKKAAEVAAVFAKVDAKDSPHTGQLVHLSPNELRSIDVLAERLARGDKIDVAKEKLLCGAESAADIALFGRMLADNPDHSVEAAAQVAHAITTHRVNLEDDYFTAVDDLKTRGEDAGAGHVGEQEFVAGVFYLYLCIDRDLLVRNLGGDESLARAAIRALADVAARVGPKGKQASFASRAYASFAMAERGAQQPRGLSVAFLSPVTGVNFLKDSAERLRKTCEEIERAYGRCADERYMMDIESGEGTLAELLDFVAK